MDLQRPSSSMMNKNERAPLQSTLDMCVCVFVNKQTRSRKGLLDTKLGRNIGLSLKLCPIAFAANIMRSNESPRLKVKI